MSKKAKIMFDGFEILAEQIDRSGANLKRATDEALQETSKIFSQNLSEASTVYANSGGGRKGYATGEMYHAIIKNSQVEWQGNVASVKYGFKISDAFQSIFIMYGTPKTSKDTKIYNALKGKKTNDEVKKAQEEIFRKYVKLGG